MFLDVAIGKGVGYNTIVGSALLYLKTNKRVSSLILTSGGETHRRINSFFRFPFVLRVVPTDIFENDDREKRGKERSF